MKSGVDVEVVSIDGGAFFVGEPPAYEIHATPVEGGRMFRISQTEIAKVTDLESGEEVNPEAWGSPSFPGHPNYHGDEEEAADDPRLLLIGEIEELRDVLAKIRAALGGADLDPSEIAAICIEIDNAIGAEQVSAE